MRSKHLGPATAGPMLLVDSNPFAPTITCYEVNDQHTEVDLATAFDELVALTAERNFDMYEAGGNGTIRKIRG